jgi:hypothetical protein
LYQTKLTNFISEFDNIFVNLLEDIENTCSDPENWESLRELTKVFFQ